jgi:hypothetical protein
MAITAAALGAAAVPLVSKAVAPALMKTFSGAVPAGVRSLGTKGLSLKGMGSLPTEYGMAALQYMPSKMERQYRKGIQEQAKRLQQQQGGLSYGQEQRALASGVGQVQSVEQERRAQLARQMGGVQAGQSGVAAQQQRDLTRQAMAGRQAVQSQVRELSIQDLRRQQAQLQQDRMRAIQMESARRQRALQALQPGVGDIEAGQRGRAAAVDETSNFTRGSSLLGGK